MTKIIKKTIPYQKYFVDSAKFLIDDVYFTEINIPENYILLDEDTGEEIDKFKRSSLKIPYKSHHVYIAKIHKHLPNRHPIRKIAILFPAKVFGNDYFYGISKQGFIDVIEYLQENGRLKFNCSKDIYERTYVKDLDIKIDFQFEKDKKAEIKKYNQQVKSRFNGSKENFHGVFDSKKNGFGFYTYDRKIGTLTKPFIKFYDKSRELLEKNYEFVKTLSPELQQEIEEKFIYRYEFTLRDKRFFDKFGISNRLEEVHEVLNDKWQEIGRTLLNANFTPKMRVPKNIDKLNLKDRLMCLEFFMNIQNGISVDEIQRRYLSVAKTKKERYDIKKLFDKIYFNTSIKDNVSVFKNYEKLKAWDKFFGFN